MSAGNSIIAKMGVDLNGLKGDLSAAEKLVVRASNDMTAKANAAAAHAGHGAGGGGSLKHTIGDSLDAITGEKGWVMRMTMLANPVTAVLAGLAIGFVKAAEAAKEMRDATKEGNDELLKSNENAVAAGDGSSVKRYEEISKSLDKIKESRSLLARIGDPTGARKSMETEVRLERERLDLVKQYGVHVREQAAAREAAAHSSSAELAHLRVAQQLEKEIAEIREKAPAGMRAAPIAAAQSEARVKNEEIDHKADETWGQLALEREILYVKMRGRDVAVSEAQARLNAAGYDVRHSKTDEEENAAKMKVEYARQALEDAELARDLEKQSIESATALAGMQGDADSKHFAALVEEGRLLQNRIDDVRTPEDERDKARRDLAKNEEARHAASIAAGAKAFDQMSADVDAHKGRGQGEEQLALLQKLQIEQIRLNYLQTTNAAPEAISKQSDKIAEMKRHYDEVAEAQAKAVTDASAENDALSEKIRHHEAIAEALKSQADIQDKINKAHLDGNAALEAKLKSQKALTLQAQIESLQRQQADRSKATLAELAANAHNQDGAAARQAMRLEARANRQRVQGHQAEADKLQNQADQIKKGISPLKDADKNEAVLRDQLAELKNIARNTEHGFRVK